MLALVLADGVPSDHALMSSRMSETVILFSSKVRGTVIVSDLRWEVDSGLWDAAGAAGEGRVRGEGSEGWSEARRVRGGGTVMRCGNVGSSCGFGTEVGGVKGSGLLIRLSAGVWSVPELAPRGNGRRESGRVRPFEESRGEESEMTWLNSREYHNTSSSSSSSSSAASASSPGRGENGPRVNSKVSSDCVSEAKRDGVDLIMRGCLEMRGRRKAAFLEENRRPGDSSSEAAGVNGISVLEQADMLVREGVGERDRGGDRRRMSRLRGGVQGAAGISLTGEAGSDAEMSMTISNELKRTD